MTDLPSASSGDDDDRTVIRPPGSRPSEGVPAPTAAPAAHGNALPVGTTLGEFEITRVLGEGGFGIVYLAVDHSLERQVALKEYMPAGLASRAGSTQVMVRSERHRETFELGRRSFVNEARLLAQFDHPSLVKVYRFWEDNGTAYMVMPFYEGRTLKEVLHDLGAPPDEAWLTGLLAPLTEALTVLHEAHCYHRDIAPDNIILLAASQRPLLLDFGAARRVIGDMTQSLTVILKPGYAPIEQYAEVPSLRQGPWTDVYALAAVVHYAITGRTPPPAVGRLMSDPSIALAESAAGRYSERFLRAIDHALAVKPEDRPQSIAEMRAELGLDGDAPAEGLPPRGRSEGATAVAGRPARPAGGPSATAAGASARTAATMQPAAAGAPSSSSRRWLPIGAAVLVLGAAGAWFALQPRSGNAPAPVASTTAPPATPPPAVAQAPSVGTAPAAGPLPAAPPQPAAAASPPAAVEGVAAAPAAAPKRASSGLPGFDQVLQAQSPGFDVEAVPARPRLRIGRDKLGFSITPSRAGYPYVLLRGPDGSLLLLYPNRMAKELRLRAGQKLTLPAASWALEATEPAGREDFLVIVSERPRDFSAAGRGRDGWFLKLPAPDRSAAAASLPSWAGRVDCPGAGCDVYGAAHFAVEVTR